MAKPRTASFRSPLPPIELRWQGGSDQSMQPESQHWIWMTLAVLALTVITYPVVPSAVQANALLIWG
jgi:hypothetical protein